jgi:hypothetical protein
MKQLEHKLNELLVTKAPFQLPDSARKWIVEYAWIFALVGLVLGLMAFFPLLAGLGLVSSFGVVFGSGRLIALAWLSLLAMGAYLVVLGIATPKLKNKEAGGWDLIYLATLAYFVYDVVYALSYISAAAIMGLIWNLIWLVVALYFIFQVRSQFKGKSSVKKK